MVEAISCRQALKRLTYIEGHLAGIRRMIEEDKLCVEILRQTHAVRRAIRKMETLILWAHLDAYVVPAVRNGRGGQGLRELIQLYTMPSQRRECDGSDTRIP